jgi:hypothetical protein
MRYIRKFSGHATYRSRSLVKQKGMVFGFRKTATAVIGPEIEDLVKYSCRMCILHLFGLCLRISGMFIYNTMYLISHSLGLYASSTNNRNSMTHELFAERELHYQQFSFCHCLDIGNV